MTSEQPQWAEQYLEQINERLERLENFFIKDYPEHRQEVERRFMKIETRLYIICIVVGLAASQASDALEWIRHFI